MSHKIEVSTEEELTALKDKCLKCKVILLEKMNKHPLSNISLFSKRQKEVFIRELKEIMDTWTDERINEEFNAIVCDDLLDAKKEVKTYPVLNPVIPPDHSILYPKKEEEEEQEKEPVPELEQEPEPKQEPEQEPEPIHEDV